jgi:hypothetical protein
MVKLPAGFASISLTDGTSELTGEKQRPDPVLSCLVPGRRRRLFSGLLISVVLLPTLYTIVATRRTSWRCEARFDSLRKETDPQMNANLRRWEPRDSHLRQSAPSADKLIPKPQVVGNVETIVPQPGVW